VISVWSAGGAIVAVMKPYQEAGRAELDQLVDVQLRAEHDGDIEAILASMAETVVHDMVGSLDNPIHGLAAVRGRYRDVLAATVHERDVPLRRLYGPNFVLDEHVWSGRLTGRAFGLEGHGRWISHRAVWLLEVHGGRIARETIWNDVEAIRRQLS
jgi:hypothetical protein